MKIKDMDWSKVESPFPLSHANKGEIVKTPLNQAFGNAKQIVSPKLNIQPIPTSGYVGGE